MNWLKRDAQLKMFTKSKFANACWPLRITMAFLLFPITHPGTSKRFQGALFRSAKNGKGEHRFHVWPSISGRNYPTIKRSILNGRAPRWYPSLWKRKRRSQIRSLFGPDWFKNARIQSTRSPTNSITHQGLKLCGNLWLLRVFLNLCTRQQKTSPKFLFVFSNKLQLLFSKANCAFDPRILQSPSKPQKAYKLKTYTRVKQAV